MFAGKSNQQYQNTRRTPNRGKRSRQKKSWEDNIIKDKKWIGMDCASITRADEYRVGGERHRCRVVRAARLRCRKSP